MEKKFRKSIKSTLLLTILLFSIVAYVNPLANADPIGVGKFVDIKIVSGEGSVTLTKLSSGETWSTATELPYDELNEKVGAGLVKLDAVETVNNYVFDYWIINGEINDEASPEFRTRKGTILIGAYFKEIIYYQVTASVSSDAPEGIITLGTEDYTVEEPYSDFVLEGTSLTFEFTANTDNHISAITLNGAYLPPEESLPIEVNQNYDIVVFFSEDGTAFVPAGTNVEVYFTETASLYFENLGTSQIANGLELIRPWGLFLWDISAITVASTGVITINLNIPLDDPELWLEVLAFTFEGEDEENAFYCDVNGDLIVTAKDLSLVANYNKLTAKHPNRYSYDPTYDTDRDGEITEDDIHLVQDYFGVSIDFEYVDWDYDPVTQTLTIYPEHFSIFRGR